MDCITPGSPVLHCLLDFAQIHVHRIRDVIQPYHLLFPIYNIIHSFKKFMRHLRIREGLAFDFS